MPLWIAPIRAANFCALLVLPPCTDYALDDGVSRPAGESSLDIAALAGVGKIAWKRRTLDAERPEQTEDLLHFMHPRFAIVRQAIVRGGMSLAVLGIPE